MQICEKSLTREQTEVWETEYFILTDGSPKGEICIDFHQTFQQIQSILGATVDNIFILFWLLFFLFRNSKFEIGKVFSLDSLACLPNFDLLAWKKHDIRHHLIKYAR